MWIALGIYDTQMSTHDVGVLISFIFVAAGLPLSLWQIAMHLRHYTQPSVQKYIVRILWMVPIYAVDSWLALCYPSSAIYFNTMRSCYEAYVIYSFYSFLLTCLADIHGEARIVDNMEHKPDFKHYMPLCFLPKVKMGEPFLNMCKRGVLAYVVIRVTTAAFAIPLEIAGEFGEGHIDFGKGYVYMALLNNAGAMYGMYCLASFYFALKEELSPIRPVPKFLCVKFVVFFSWWQGVTLAILAWTGVLHRGQVWEKYTVHDVQVGCQNFAICVEMFFAAIAHHFAYSYQEFVIEGAEAGVRRSWGEWWWLVIDIDGTPPLFDVARDLNSQIPDEVTSYKDSVAYHVDEQTRLLGKALEGCCGERFKKKGALEPDKLPRKLPEDYGRDDNKWEDTP